MRRTRKPERVCPTVLLLSGLLCVSLLLSGCGTQVPEAAVSDELVVGLLLDSIVVERWQRDRAIFSARAKELGAEVIVRNCNEDNDLQRQQIHELADAGVDVLVVVPYDKDGIAEEITQVRKRGIPVIAYDRLILNANVDLYISFDNIRVGEIMAGSLAEAVPEGQYVIINGSPLDNNSIMFNKGFHIALAPGIAAGTIDVRSETWAEAWRPEVAYETVSALLGEEAEMNAVIAANDGLAGAVIRALAERRLAGTVQVVGHDADLSACQRIAEGTQLMTVYKPLGKLAKQAAEAAVALAKGEGLQAESTIDDGTAEVPYIRLAPVPVTRDNLVQTVIADGFHSYDEVYLNVPEEDRPPRE